LVLLDEVGGGTDPTEGAALGMALLQSFAERKPGGSLLTMATTHHGELKTLKYSDPRFENACVEFDEGRLAPTFRLLWGIPGELIGPFEVWYLLSMSKGVRGFFRTPGLST
jgi:dsDNA-specific endonuclease/ATPase MutS2